MSKEEDTHNIEISLEQANRCINTMEALQRLIANKDFDDLITKGYFENEASRLVLMRGDPSMNTLEHQESLLKSIDGIASFRQYLRTIMQIGAMAQRDKAAAEEELNELEDEAPGVH